MMHAVVQAAKVQGVVFIDILFFISIKTMESAKQRPLKGKNIHNFTFRISAPDSSSLVSFFNH